MTATNFAAEGGVLWPSSWVGPTTPSARYGRVSCVDNPRSCVTRPGNPATKSVWKRSSSASPNTPDTSLIRSLINQVSHQSRHGLCFAGRLVRRISPARLAPVVAIHCPVCDHWVPPRRFRIPAMVCRDCASVVQPPVRPTRPVTEGSYR